MLSHDSSGQYPQQLPDEGGPLAHLLELAGTDVGAGRADASKHIEHGDGDVPPVGNLHALTLTRPEGWSEGSSGLDDICQSSITFSCIFPFLLYACITCTRRHRRRVSPWQWRRTSRRTASPSPRSSLSPTHGMRGAKSADSGTS